MLQLLKSPAAGGAPVTLLDAAAWCTDISIDSRLVCMRPLPSGEGQGFLMPLAAGEPAPLSDIPATAKSERFGPDGRLRTWLVTQEGADELWSLVPGKVEPRRLARLEGKEIADFAWSHDGTRLAVVKTVNSGDVVLLKRPPT